MIFKDKKAEKLLPEVGFPPYKFELGKKPHPEKNGGHGFAYAQIESENAIDNTNYLASKTYLHAIDLFNFEYYWEAHVWFEKLWLKSIKNTEQKSLLSALILLSACLLKLENQKMSSFYSLLKKSKKQLESTQSQIVLGIEIEQIKKLLKRLENNSDYRPIIKLRQSEIQI